MKKLLLAVFVVLALTVVSVLYGSYDQNADAPDGFAAVNAPERIPGIIFDADLFLPVVF